MSKTETIEAMAQRIYAAQVWAAKTMNEQVVMPEWVAGGNSHAQVNARAAAQAAYAVAHDAIRDEVLEEVLKKIGPIAAEVMFANGKCPRDYVAAYDAAIEEMKGPSK